MTIMMMMMMKAMTTTTTTTTTLVTRVATRCVHSTASRLRDAYLILWEVSRALQKMQGTATHRAQPHAYLWMVRRRHLRKTRLRRRVFIKMLTQREQHEQQMHTLLRWI
jgi:hypothetical protein